MFRILFVIIAAAVITFSTILLGSYLQKKVAAAEAMRATSEPAQEQITSRPKISENSASQRSVFGAGIDVSQYSTEDEVVAAVNALAEHYNTVIVRLNSSDGNLLYTSPALCSAVRVPVPEQDDCLSLLRSALTAAKSKNLYLCAVFNTSFGTMSNDTAALLDGTLFAELASFGVDEILISGVIEDAENIPAGEIVSYLNSCMAMTGGSCAIGLSIPDEVFLNFSNAKNIETIASSVDFTAIDMTIPNAAEPADVYEQVTEDVTSLYGSFSIYNMRVVLSTSDSSLLAAQYTALCDCDITNICFTGTILPSSLNYAVETSTPEAIPDDIPAETEVPVGEHSNPYANGVISDDSNESKDLSPEENSFDNSDGGSYNYSYHVGDSWYTDENGNKVKPWY